MIKIAYQGFSGPRNSITTFSKTYDVIKMLNDNWLVIWNSYSNYKCKINDKKSLSGVFKPDKFNKHIFKHV